jgi:homoserine dehydrogenase
MKRVNVALLGLGTVGTGTYKMLQSNQDVIARKTGTLFEVRRILVRDLTKKRKVEGVKHLLTTRFEDVLDAGVQVVIEAMGGIEPTRTYVMKAIEAGCHVVTANKELIAKHGVELEQLAREKGVQLLYEASVGGGIPVLGTLQHLLKANRIHKVSGIVNGTCNYILTQMSEYGRSFDSVLAEAQEKGYAEADPTADVEGFDSAHKLAILCRLAFGVDVAVDDIPRKGITDITVAELEIARRLGYSIKLLAQAEQYGEEGPVALQVAPTLVPLSHPLSGVRGVYNAIHVEGDVVQDVTLVGQGAGEQPTGSAVVEDLCNVYRLPALRAASLRRPMILPAGEESGIQFLLIETEEVLAADVADKWKADLLDTGIQVLDALIYPDHGRSHAAFLVRNWEPRLVSVLPVEWEVSIKRIITRPVLAASVAQEEKEVVSAGSVS